MIINKVRLELFELNFSFDFFVTKMQRNADQAKNRFNIRIKRGAVCVFLLFLLEIIRVK